MKKIKLTKKIEKDIREDSVRVRKAWFKKLREFADKFEKNPTDLNKMYLLGFISSADFIIITFKAMQHPKTDRELREEFHIYSIKMAHQSADGELDMKEIEGKIADFWLAKMRGRGVRHASMRMSRPRRSRAGGGAAARRGSGPCQRRGTCQRRAGWARGGDHKGRGRGDGGGGGALRGDSRDPKAAATAHAATARI